MANAPERGKMTNKELGKIGEEMASKYMEQNGYKVLARNYRTSKGEIDIIAANKERIHFVEVKTRQGDKFGRPAESVDGRKISHMRAAAGAYLAKTRERHGPGRCPQFDVIEIQIDYIGNI